MTTVLANPNKVAWAYTTDDEQIFRMAAKYAIVSQLTDAAVTVGGAAADGNATMPHRRFKPRYVVLSGGTTKKVRKVTVYSPTAPIWTDNTATITLLINGVDEVCNVTGHVGERLFGGIQDATHQ
jgi:hypothetical protein